MLRGTRILKIKSFSFLRKRVEKECYCPVALYTTTVDSSYFVRRVFEFFPRYCQRGSKAIYVKYISTYPIAKKKLVKKKTQLYNFSFSSYGTTSFVISRENITLDTYYTSRTIESRIR